MRQTVRASAVGVVFVMLAGLALVGNGPTTATASVNQPSRESEPATTTPIAAQNFKLTAAEPIDQAKLGYSVAIDGATIVVGAPSGLFDGRCYRATGAAHVYSRTGGSWFPEAELVGSGAGQGFSFGFSVAASDGRILVTSRGRDELVGPGVRTGAAYVYERVGGRWTERAKLVSPAGQVDDQFGFCADLDGPTAVVGAFWGELCYVFRRTAGVWIHEGTLPGWVQDVAVGGDRVVIPDGTPEVYSRTATGWAVDCTLPVGGWAADIDGDTIAIGDAWASEAAGKAYVFTRRDGSWVMDAELTASDATPQARFGGDLAIEGDTLLVSARQGCGWGDSADEQRRGAVYVFERTGSGWVERKKLMAWRPSTRYYDSNWVDDWFGWSVDLDGDTAITGAHGDCQHELMSGAAYVFNPVSIDCTSSRGVVSFGGTTTVAGELTDIRGRPVTATANVRLLRTAELSGMNPVWSLAGNASRDGISGIYRAGTRLFANNAFALQYVSSSGDVRSRGRETVVLSRAYLPRPIVPVAVRPHSGFAAVGILKPVHSTGITRVEWFRKAGDDWVRYGSFSGRNRAASGYSVYRAQCSLPRTGLWRTRARHWDASHAETYSGWRYVRVL